ncbi:hypothetical protein [Agrococcus sp. UYP10]|uniref:hypothetical protein n=1 Tax=Agrococcus sp. UYP10 TaxID=1756355 RepID=UPI003398798C
MLFAVRLRGQEEAVQHVLIDGQLHVDHAVGAAQGAHRGLQLAPVPGVDLGGHLERPDRLGDEHRAVELRHPLEQRRRRPRDPERQVRARVQPEDPLVTSAVSVGRNTAVLETGRL